MNTLSERIAVLEDQLLMRVSLRELLERKGFEVVGDFADLPSFLSQANTLLPSVAIVDLGLEAPGGGVGDGLDVLREIRRHHPEIRLIVFSGSSDDGLIEKSLAHGASAFLHKLSTNAETIFETIRQVSGGQVATPAAAPSPLSSLSKREREVLSYLATGADNLKIATHLQISERTVRAHVSSLYRKLGSENRTHLALLALQLGLRPPPHV